MIDCERVDITELIDIGESIPEWSTLLLRLGGGESDRSTLGLLNRVSSLSDRVSTPEMGVWSSKASTVLISSNPEKSSSISRPSIMRKSSVIESTNLLSMELGTLSLRVSQRSLEGFD